MFIMLFLWGFLLNISINCYSASHHPQDFLKEVSGAKHEGSLIVEHYCAMCHAEKPLVSLGAPRIGNSADWEPRLTSGLDVLFKHLDSGYNAMPARGGCFECSDKQLMMAINALLPKSKKTIKRQSMTTR